MSKFKDMILGLIRHGLTTLGGYLVGVGLLSSNDTEAFVSGLVVLIGMLWSVLDKHFKHSS